MTIAFNLDSIVAEGYLAAGVKPSVIAARSNAGRELVERLNMSGRARVAPNINKWSKQDDDFMRAHYRYMTDEEVGQTMGRSAVAVVIRRKRLGLPAPSKHPDELTATAIKHLLGVDEHAICSWRDKLGKDDDERAKGKFTQALGYEFKARRGKLFGDSQARIEKGGYRMWRFMVGA